MLETDTDNLESLLLSIPVEIRREIYKLVLDTGSIDAITKGRVYIIKDRHALRTASSRVRIKNYSLANVSSKSTALEQACAQIRDEIQHYLGKSVFKFTDTGAFMGFLGCQRWEPSRVMNENNHIALQAAARVVVSVEERAWIPYGVSPFSVWVEYDLMDLADAIVHPFMVTFVGEEGESSEQLIQATNMWKERMERI
jgi:hypothetical protein